MKPSFFRLLLVTAAIHALFLLCALHQATLIPLSSAQLFANLPALFFLLISWLPYVSLGCCIALLHGQDIRDWRHWWLEFFLLLLPFAYYASIGFLATFQVTTWAFLARIYTHTLFMGIASLIFGSELLRLACGAVALYRHKECNVPWTVWRFLLPAAGIQVLFWGYTLICDVSPSMPVDRTQLMLTIRRLYLFYGILYAGIGVCVGLLHRLRATRPFQLLLEGGLVLLPFALYAITVLVIGLLPSPFRLAYAPYYKHLYITGTFLFGAELVWLLTRIGANRAGLPQGQSSEESQNI